MRSAASTLAATGNGGVGELEGDQVGGEVVLRGLHQRAVEGCGDLQHDGALGFPLPCRGRAARWTAAAAPEMTVWSGELRLAGETTARFGLKLAASGVLGSGVSWSETCSQMTLMRSAERPRMAAMAPSPAGTACCMYWPRLRTVRTGVGEAEGSGGDVGAVFAQRMAGGERGRDAFFSQHALGGDRDGQDGGLGVLGELEVFFGAFKMSFESGKPRASSASSKTALAVGKLL